MMLTRLKRHGAPLALATLTTFAVSLVQANTAWAQRGSDRATPQMPSAPAWPAQGDVASEGPGALQSEPASATPARDAVTPVDTSVPGQGNAQKANPDFADSTGTGQQPLALPTGDKSGVTNKVISVPGGSGKVDGMGESFSAQLSTGNATFTVPLLLPEARGGAQPSLSLSYSSSGGAGVAGQGWDVGVPFIARQTDRGAPRYLDEPGWHADQDRFVFNGGEELVPICVVGAGLACARALSQVSTPAGPVDEAMPAWSQGWQYFRPRVEGSFQRFFWSPDHLTWRVQDKSGNSMELGLPRDGGNPNAPERYNALERNPDRPREIYRWHLTRQYDSQGAVNCGPGEPQPVNVVVYRYFQDGGAAYLSDIFDTTPADDATTTEVSSYAHHTRLVYEARTDPTHSYRSGWRIDQRQRLKQIDITSKTFNDALAERRLVRRYHLEYAADQHASLLAGLQVEGRCSDEENGAPVEETDGTVPPTSCARLPPMKFGYSHVTPFKTNGAVGSVTLAGYEGFDERVRSIAGSPPHSLDEQLTELMDIDSDALPDVLVTAGGVYGPGHGVFFGSRASADAFLGAESMCIEGVLGATTSTLSLSNLNLATLDLDGDATVDLLHMPKTRTYAVYTPRRTQQGWCWQGRTIDTASSQSPKIDLGKDAAETRVIDVNEDGLLDVVVATGTELQTFFALGRLPGGDGQFGYGKPVGEFGAELSNDPVTSCVPWSGSPVHFSDKDVKLGDMNGDGLTDIIRLRRGDIRYWPGRKNGYWGTGHRDDCAAGTFGESRDVAMSSSPQYSDIEGDSMRLDDVNGDGLTDLVQVRFDEIDIWLNVDGEGWTDRHIIRGTPNSPGYADRVRLVDVNGSGTSDILWGNAGSYRYIDLQGGVQPWLLTSIENGFGKSTTLEYSTSVAEMLAAESEAPTDDDRGPWSKRMPISVQVVKRVVDRDNLASIGRAGGVYVTEYSYRDPVYEGRQREFRGFKKTRTVRIGDANSPTDITKTTYLLGECVDLDASEDVDTCDNEHRYLDNSRDALKGLPVVTETRNEAGVYLSTEHFTYTLRHLYSGLDGRAVRQAFGSATNKYLYETTGFVPASETVTAIADVVVEGASEPGATSGFTLRSSAGRVTISSSSVVDAFGNGTKSTANGCVAGCTPVDEVIHTHSEPVRPTGDCSGWIWRTGKTFVTGSAHAGNRNETRTTYDSSGNALDTFLTLSGTLPLDRTNAAGMTQAPAPPNASSNGEFRSLHREYDTLGNVVKEVGTNGGCTDIGYDDEFEHLATSETISVGGTPPFTVGQCGPDQLATGAAYDRALAQPTVVTDANFQSTKIGFDSLGRVHVIARPRPDGSIPELSSPSTRITYFLPNEDGPPYSEIHTETEDGVGPGGYLESWAFVDGLGRTLITLNESEIEHEWIVSGFTTYDAKGAPERKHLPELWLGGLAANGGTAASISGTPPVGEAFSPYARQAYDAFGREIRRWDIDGTRTLESDYHALSTDVRDANDITSPGHHASERTDGHGRTVEKIERNRVDSTPESRYLLTRYLPTGEAEVITRKRGSDQVVRWMRYDSLGRMVFNVEPNASANFDPNPSTPAPPVSSYSATALKGWRYAYNDSGNLVGTSDARGCGVNFHYDAGGRLRAEDYSPCVSDVHATYSEADVAAGTGVEVLYQYDNATVPDGSGLDAPPTIGANGDPGYSLQHANGRLVAVHDRASSRWSNFDARGRVVLAAVRVAQSNPPASGFSNRYAPRWYYKQTTHDVADREIHSTTGARVTQLLGTAVPAAGTNPYNQSAVSTTYTTRGTVQDVAGSFGPLVTEVARAPDGQLTHITYGDAASTTTDFAYDERRRLFNIRTDRDVPALWSSPPPNYQPPPDLNPGTPTTFQTLLQNDTIAYDDVGNPTEIHDLRDSGKWPAKAKPVTRVMQYDDLYRITRVDYDHAADGWISPFEAENTGSTPDPRRATPSPQVSFPGRTTWQTFQYDWLGNSSRSDDNAGGFYDRSLGLITNGTANAQPYQLKTADNNAVAGATSTGLLSTVYDTAGNLTRLSVRRNGDCQPTLDRCSQRYAYDWDEVGRLTRARRWDFAALSLEPATAALPETTPAADLTNLYDATDTRILKKAVGGGSTSHTLYIFNSLELRRAAFGGSPADYTRDEWTEVPYLFSRGVRVARVVYEDATVPSIAGARMHVFLELDDHLGSASVVLDKATGELVERTTFYAYGGTESDYRPQRWEKFREDYRFTGKEEDVEVGLQYFGKRYLNPLLGRWMSPDPLTVHTYGSDLNVYAYVSGTVLKATDPIGLADSPKEGLAGFVYGLIDSAAAAGDRKIAEAKTAVVQSFREFDAEARSTAAALHRKEYKQGALYLARVAYKAGPGKAIEPVKALIKVPAAIERGSVEAGGSIVRATKAGSDREAGREAAGAVGAAMEFTWKVLSPVASGGPLAPKGGGGTRAGLATGVRTGCFVAGTPVWTAEGLKPIELVEQGEWVLSSSDEGGGPPTWRQVSETLPKPASEVMSLGLQDDRGHTDSLGVTPEHPFWVDRIGWATAGSLQPGDRVWSLERGWLDVISVRLQSRLQRVYNLEVDEDRTYAVGQLAAWVHNECYRAKFQTWLKANGYEELPREWDAHHRIPQAFKEHKEFKNFDFDDPTNIRGVSGHKNIDGSTGQAFDIHGQITKEWEAFRKANKGATRAQIEAFADKIDKKHGKTYWKQKAP
jgi:RHS repeat-associated protein